MDAKHLYNRTVSITSILDKQCLPCGLTCIISCYSLALVLFSGQNAGVFARIGCVAFPWFAIVDGYQRPCFDAGDADDD
ncbi:hypothetical protein BC940DRAFT_311778 [Gongronella butleri]|nr:hypothetical protein BC940DRAFT_311778 [Gongronella butleri]